MSRPTGLLFYKGKRQQHVVKGEKDPTEQNRGRKKKKKQLKGLYYETLNVFSKEEC